MEGPLAPVQVSQEETRGVRLPEPGTKAPENISLVCFCLQFLQVRGLARHGDGAWTLPEGCPTPAQGQSAGLKGHLFAQKRFTERLGRWGFSGRQN